MEKDTNVTAPDEIWANVTAWSFGQALTGEWNYQDVGSPDDTRYIRADLLEADAKRIAELEAALYAIASLNSWGRESWWAIRAKAIARDALGEGKTDE